MNPERWQQLKEILENAWEKDASERALFLDEACRDNPSLREEVEALLNSRDDDSFLEKPVYEEVPELFESISGDSLIGGKVGAYEITGKIGQGGMGVVYLARDERLDRTVAIKMLAPKYTGDAQQRERLRREAKAAARLSHPGIATVYALEEHENSLYIVSEYVRGQTLRQIIKESPLPFPKILDAAIQITKALAAAHEQGIVHRDLKPENIIQTESGDIKILDFGLARLIPRDPSIVDPTITRAGMFLGTPAYASPEQLLGSEVDRNTDIFSLGILLYELAAGKNPFISQDPLSTIARILEAKVPDLTQINTSLPLEFDQIIRRCLSKKPQDRFADTRDLTTAFSRLKEQSSMPPQSSDSSLGWWQFHQAVAGFGYYGMLYPLWIVKKTLIGIQGSTIFFVALIAVGIAANLRLHLWFTSQFYRSELSEQRRKASRWIRWADLLFVAVCAVSAALMHTLHAVYATLLLSVAVGSLVASFFIEPTTARAALDRKP